MSCPAASSSASAIARALVTEPALLLADEPTGNLDSSSTAEILGLLHDLHATGRTIVLITHEVDVAAQAGRIIRLRDGRIDVPAAAGGRSMTWRDTFRTAAEAVRTHRLRSALTMLGILIGITAVILTVGLGNGAKAEVREQINELGTNLLVVSPGSSTNSTGVRGGFGSSSTLTGRRCRGPELQRRRPRHRGRRSHLDHAGLADLRRHELDDDAHGHDAVVDDDPLPRGLERALPHGGRPAGRGQGGRARTGHRDRAVRPAQPRRPAGRLQRDHAAGRRRARGAELVRPDQQQRRGHRAALDVRRAPRGWQQPQRRRRRST